MGGAIGFCDEYVGSVDGTISIMILKCRKGGNVIERYSQSKPGTRYEIQGQLTA